MTYRTSLMVCVAGLLVAGPVGSVFATPITTDLTFWVKADAGVTKDGSNYVTAWADQSPDSQPSAGPDGTQPLWVDSALNGMPVIRFDGNDRLITGRPNNSDALSDPIQGQYLTAFVVAERNALVSSSSTAVFMQNGDGRDWHGGPESFVLAAEEETVIMLRTIRDGSVLSKHEHPGNAVPYIFATVFDGTNNTSYLNGTAATAVGSTDDFDIDDVIIGARWNNNTIENPYDGDIAELIVYEAALSANEQNQVGYYLQQKYGISGTYTPEPATLALVGLGGLGLVLGRKRRR